MRVLINYISNLASLQIYKWRLLNEKRVTRSEVFISRVSEVALVKRTIILDRVDPKSKIL
jgi:hypothetical protein